MKSFLNWVIDQINWGKTFLQEPDGKGSIKRLIMFLITISFLRAYFKVALITNNIVDIPENWMFLLAGIIGLGILDRYLQLNGSKDK